jgi:hypothetical protein
MTARARFQQALAWSVVLVVLGGWLWLTDQYRSEVRFGRVGHVLVILWYFHSMLCAVAALAVYRRRFDVLAVLLIGPCLAGLLLGFEEKWSDPDWHVIFSVFSIGMIVGIPVTLAYWIVKRVTGS